jgi:hypothetical protein
MSHVWYVSYGSNMSSARFACYVQGGRPAGGTRVNPGARDRTLPARSIPVDLPGTVYFAGRSPQWGGGVAFYDHAEPGRTAARGYLVTPGQLADIAAQEMYRVPVAGDPLEEVVVGLLGDGRHQLGPGRYETLLEVGRHDGLPLLTFTSPHGIGHVEPTQPSAAYLETVAQGLRESRGWDDEQVATYLAALLGEDRGQRPGDGRSLARRGLPH